jgi:hypothetical protein
MPTIEVRTTGRRNPLVPQWQVPVPPGAADGMSPLTLRDLIERVVRGEVEAFRRRQRDGAFVALLTEERLEGGLARGRVAPGRRALNQRVDPDEAAGVALAAFEEGLYLVVVDGRQRTDLDEQVVVGPDSALVFVRLVPLVGG